MAQKMADFSLDARKALWVTRILKINTIVFCRHCASKQRVLAIARV